MTKKHFIALADKIRYHNGCRDDLQFNDDGELKFTYPQLLAIASFCKSQNFHFKEDRWLGYIAGTNGPNGGKVK